MKVGVIGIGVMGYNYVKVISQLRDVELVGVVDNNEEVLTKISKNFGINIYDNGKDFFNKEKPDVVVISCPEKYHAEYTIMAIERNINVHLEKPVSDTMEGCYQILEASKKSKAKLNIGFILRVFPQYALIKDRIDSRKFGEVIHFSSRRNGSIIEGLRWEGKNDLFTYLVCHDADIFMWITGLKIERVYAEQTFRSLKHFNVHDTVQVLFKCNNNSIGTIECSWALPENSNISADMKLELIGTKEMAHIDLLNQGLNLYTEKGFIQKDMNIFPDIGNNFVIGALKNEFEMFLNSIFYSKNVMCTIEEGIEATKIGIASKYSVEKGTPVYIKDIF